MQIEESIAIMKALGDKSRLSIMQSLLGRPQYAEEIAKRHGLAASTVSFHLRKLEQAGLITSRKEQYYVVVQANQPLLETTLRELVAAPFAGKELQDERMDQHRRKVLESFFKHGMLEKLPTQHKKRLIVLEQFALRFTPQQKYSESEVTGLIRPLFDDYCTIRRLLVDEGLIRRDGATYWREAECLAEPALPQELPREKETADVSVPQQNRRAEIKRLYKQDAPDFGIYQIRNKVNGKLYLGSSKNLEATRKSRLFQLRMGTVVFNPDLQRELNQYGAESFEFSVLAVLERPEPGENQDRLLAALELHWMEKLQPFGESGYNSLKGFQRAKAQFPGLA
jgi:DNA-binding HxlR family transcriptional regulator